jgi:acyl-CoA thioesterase I
MRERQARRQGRPRVSHMALPLLLAALLLLSGCNGFASSRRATATATPSPTPLPTGTPGPRLMFAAIGASDAYGVGTANPAKDNWPTLLAGDLGPSVRLTNLGIPGATVAIAQRDELPIALHIQPDLVTVFLGVNDLLDNVTTAAFTTQISALLIQLHTQTAARVFIGNLPDVTLLPEFSRFDPIALRTQVIVWNAAIAHAAAEAGANVVDLFNGWGELAQHPDYVSPDGLHPSTVGAERLAAVFAAAIEASGL